MILKLILLLALTMIVISMIVIAFSIEKMKEDKIRVYRIYNGKEISEEESKMYRLYAYECEKDIIYMYYILK